MNELPDEDSSSVFPNEDDYEGAHAENLNEPELDRALLDVNFDDHVPLHPARDPACCYVRLVPRSNFAIQQTPTPSEVS
jgi:hypothetical protein